MLLHRVECRMANMTAIRAQIGRAASDGALLLSTSYPLYSLLSTFHFLLLSIFYCLLCTGYFKLPFFQLFSASSDVIFCVLFMLSFLAVPSIESCSHHHCHGWPSPPPLPRVFHQLRARPIHDTTTNKHTQLYL